MSLHNPNNDWDTVDKDDIDLYFHEYESLAYDTEYWVNIRGSNRVNDSFRIQGPANWIHFKTPSCWNLTRSVDFCGPMAIKGFVADIQAVEGNVFAFNITWNEPIVRPEYYELVIRDIDATRDEYGSEGIYEYQLHKVSRKSTLAT